MVANPENITISSGEAELVAAVKASTEIIGLTQLASEWGEEFRAQVFVDSSAALGVVKRKGNGKMRHVRVGMLWIQQKSEDGDIAYSKVLGERNPADLFTKHLAKAVIDRHCEYVRTEFTGGRASASLRVN